MTERRCPNCGGLVAEGIEFCGQCFHRVPMTTPEPATVEPVAEVEARPTPEASKAPEAPEVPAAGAPAAGAPAAVDDAGRFLRAEDGSLMWACPACELHNPIEAMSCTRCGTPFRHVFGEERPPPTVDPARAVRLSLIFPGLGHRALGRSGEGLSRAVFFLWSFGTTVAILLLRRGAGLGQFLPMVLVLSAFAIALYSLTAVDAGRTARRQDPLVSTRTLLYGGAGVMLLTVVMMVLLTFSARR